MVAGFRHPCRNDGVIFIVSGEARSGLQPPFAYVLFVQPCLAKLQNVTDKITNPVRRGHCSPDGAACGAIRVCDRVLPDFRSPSSIRATAYAVA